jgi:hypothetical protein
MDTKKAIISWNDRPFSRKNDQNLRKDTTNLWENGSTTWKDGQNVLER